MIEEGPGVWVMAFERCAGRGNPYYIIVGLPGSEGLLKCGDGTTTFLQAAFANARPRHPGM
jgi:hypothetical protein